MSTSQPRRRWTEVLLILFLPFSCAVNDLYQWTAEDGKHLWCPNECLESEIDLDKDRCCACDGLPEWELPDNVSKYRTVNVELLSVDHKIYKILSLPSVATSIQNQFVFTNGDLRTFPKNLCEIAILVKIDLSNNHITDIDDISCLSMLDTLLLARNRISSLSNQTFANIRTLRYVDLSYNQISKMDYNVYQLSSIFTLILDGNTFTKLDIANIFKVNKTACKSSYRNNIRSLELTNEGDFQVGTEENIICSDTDLSNVSMSTQPLFLFTKNIDMRKITSYFPCGGQVYDGTAYSCDCHVAEFLCLHLDDMRRFLQKSDKYRYCNSPQPLVNKTITEVYSNQTARDLMTCDIVDYCPKNGNCKCTCTSQPNRGLLRVDCSNQSCTDFPEVVPDTKHKIILNMTNNLIANIHTNKYYFSNVQTLDLTGNPIQSIDKNISAQHSLNDLIIPNHELFDLPKEIQLLDPNIIHFGHNGIPCTCENRWIAEWRQFKNASKEYPYALRCSNYNGDGMLIEEQMKNFTGCEDNQDNKWIYPVVAIPGVLIASLTYYCCRVEILVWRRVGKSKLIYRQAWEYDVYVSLDDNNDDVRTFVLGELHRRFQENGLTSFIPCRDEVFGRQKEDSIKDNLVKCKYCLIIQSRSMYSSVNNHNSRRLEYTVAWNHFVERKIATIFIIKYDDDAVYFMARTTRALRRFGLVFDIYNRQQCLNKVLINVFDKPLNKDRN